MAEYSCGESVIVAGRGPGVVTDVIGGPLGKLYRVTLIEPTAYGFSTSYTTDENELVSAVAIPTYQPGDPVVYQRRPAEVVAYDPSNGAVEIRVLPPLPDPDPPVNIDSKVVLSAWEVYFHQLKG